MRVMFNAQLWFTYLKNGNKHYSVLGVEIEEDRFDPTVKIYSLVLFGLAISIGGV